MCECVSASAHKHPQTPQGVCASNQDVISCVQRWLSFKVLAITGRTVQRGACLRHHNPHSLCLINTRKEAARLRFCRPYVFSTERRRRRRNEESQSQSETRHNVALVGVGWGGGGRYAGSTFISLQLPLKVYLLFPLRSFALCFPTAFVGVDTSNAGGPGAVRALASFGEGRAARSIVSPCSYADSGKQKCKLFEVLIKNLDNHFIWSNPI